VISLCAALFCGAQAMANPSVRENWTNYAVDGRDAGTILNQMAQRGPNGFWAYTTWYVRWTANCRVSLEIDYILPRHSRPNALPEHLRVRWAWMHANLVRHERKHGQHGINAANELIAKRCRNGDSIIQKWANADRRLDARTGHGRTEGVVFP
jgi:predicted secreted Zn-dependent protease